MKTTDFLQDAIGLIDDDLIEDSRRLRDTHTAGWIRWVAAVACLGLVVGSVFFFRPIDPQNSKSTIHIAENLWEKDNFNAYSLSYRAANARRSVGSSVQLTVLSETQQITKVSDSLHPPENTVSSHSISITQNQTFKFETLIAHRYAVYLSETGFPVFYDTVQDHRLDLQKQILGDTGYILDALKETATDVAGEIHPGFLSSEGNRKMLDLYLTYTANDTLTIHWDEITAITPDTSFLDTYEEYRDYTEEVKQEICRNLCWEIYCGALAQMDDALVYQPYVVRILGIDDSNGILIIRVNDIVGNGTRYLVYDIRTDTSKPLPEDPSNALIGTMSVDGYIFRFSKDGSIAAIAYPDASVAGVNGAGMPNDITQRFIYDTVERVVYNYQGERYGVFFLEGEMAYRSEMRNSIRGSSELFVSSNNSVLYYKVMDEEAAGRTFYASDSVWYNRLKLYNRDTDCWAFHRVDADCIVGDDIVLQGNFVRFAADETIVVMERGGSYYAYSLTDGSDITQSIRDGKVSMYAHEQMIVTHREGFLYAINVFTGTGQLIAPADAFLLSDDGAFVFAYCNGDEFVTCYNIASLESCRITVDSEVCAQLFAREDAVLQMSYNEEENTLLLSYYVETDISNKYDSDISIYEQLKLLESDDPGDPYPRHPQIITDLTVTEDVMEHFRDSAYCYDHPNGIIHWYTYYPELFTPHTNRSQIFKSIGLTEPEAYLNVNGTQFVLYEDEDEKLLLTFYKYWMLFDYDDQNAGFMIEYISKGKNYYYTFSVSKE